MKLLVIQGGTARRVAVKPLGPGQAGNLETLNVAIPMIRDAALDEGLRQFAEALIVDCAPRDSDCEIGKLFEFAQQIRYVEDPIDGERLADAWATIHDRQGDCLDKAALLASLLGSIGRVTRLVCVNYYGDLAEHGFDHIYLEALRHPGAPDEQWQALDPTNEREKRGWEAPAPVRWVAEIWPTERPGIAGLFDQILGQVIGQGVQLGGQYVASEIHQGQVSRAQQDAIGHQFDAHNIELAAGFRQLLSLPAITAEEYSQAQQAVTALSVFAQQNSGVSYVAHQWADAAPDYAQVLAALQSKVIGAANVPGSQTAVSNLLVPSGGAVPGTTTTTAATPWYTQPAPLAVAVIAALLFLRR